MNYIFSIIVPIYNTEEFVERCIKSIIGQTLGFKRIQLILVDCRGCDLSEEICEKYVGAYPENIIYIKRENLNLSMARNIGMEQASGDLLGFVDAGDVLSNDVCSEIYEYFRVVQDYVDVAVVPVYSYGVHKGPHYLNGKFKKGNRTVNLKDAKWFEVCTRVSQAFFRTEVAKKYIFDETLIYGEDIKFVNEVLLNKKRIGIVSKAKYYQQRFSKEYASAIPDIDNSANKEYYLDVPNKVFRYFLDLNDKEASVYLQYLVLVDFKWRVFFKTNAAKEILTAKEYEEYCSINRELLLKISDEVILQCDFYEAWQKIYLLNLKYDTDILEKATYDDDYRLVWNNHLIYDSVNNRQINLQDIDLLNGSLHVKGYVCAILIGDVSVHAICGETRIKANIQKDAVDVSVLPLDNKTYKYIAFDVRIPLSDTKQTITFTCSLGAEEWDIEHIGISRNGVLEHVRPSRQIRDGYEIVRTSNGLELEKVEEESDVVIGTQDSDDENMEGFVDEREDSIVVDNVSVKFNLAEEKVDSLKDYLIKSLKGEIKREEFWALQNVSFTLKKGDRLGILGLNGSGKSTILKVIAGVYKPTQGSVKKNGLLLPMLELGAGFDMEYTGRENVFLYGSVLGLDREFMAAHYDEIESFSELGKFMDVPLKNYSSGMRSRLGFAIATVVKPDILILDEVLSVGDAKFRKKSEDKMLELINDGTTVLFVSHSLAQVRKICNKAIILNKGHVVSFGDIDEVSTEYERITKS